MARYFDGGSHVYDGEGAVIDGGGSSGGFFVEGGAITFRNSTFFNFSTRGGSGSGGGAGLGGVIFVNDGASVVLSEVSFLANTVTGGEGGVGSVGGSLNGLIPILSGLSGQAGASGSGEDAYLNSGSGRDGYNGERGMDGTKGAGGSGGKGGDGSDGSTITLNNVSAAFDIAKSTYKSASTGTEAGIYTAIAATFTAQAAAAAAGVNVGGPTTAHLAAAYTTLATQYGSLAANATADVSQAVADGLWEAAKLVALETTVFELGLAGGGGSGGSGGAGGHGSFGFGGGAGGFGGSGGDAASSSGAVGGSGGDGGAGGNGGFGAGGGRGGNSGTPGSDGFGVVNASDWGGGGSGGPGGFGGGRGADGDDHPNAPTQGGSGGDGLGGAIFIRSGGSVTITGSARFAGNNSIGGAAQSVDNVPGVSGVGLGSDIFLMKGATLTLNPGEGNVVSFNSKGVASIADDSYIYSSSRQQTSAVPAGQGADVVIQSGLVEFNGVNAYNGQTRIEGGVLQALDGHGIHVNSNINLAGGVLQSRGVFDRFTGTQSDRVQWTGAGGFAAAGEDLSVRLNDGTQLTWGSASFVPNARALVFGSESSTHDVHFQNAINLGGSLRTILVRANSSGDNAAYLHGAISNGALWIGSPEHRGTLVLTGANTYTGGTTVQYGTLALGEGGSLADSGPVDLRPDGVIDTSLAGNQAIGTLAGSGGLDLGSHTLTLKQSLDSIFSGSIRDGGIAGGVGASLVKELGGTLTLSGTNTYTGSTTVSAGGLVIEGTLASASVKIAEGASLVNQSGGLDSASTLDNDGVVTLNVDQTVGAFVNTGTLDGGSSKLTAATYALNGGSTINANLGVGSVTTNGAVLLNGTSDAGLFLVESGTTTLGGGERLDDLVQLTVSEGASLVLGGDETIGGLFGGGSVDNPGYLLTVGEGAFGGRISGAGSLQKSGSGTLALTGVNTYTGRTQVEEGILELSGDGRLASTVARVAEGATLNNLNGGLDSASFLFNDGLFHIGKADQTIQTLVNTGRITGEATLTASEYFLNGTSVDANLGTGRVDVLGDTALNGTSDASVFVVSSGTTTLGSAERLRDDTTLGLASETLLKLGGDETIGSLFGPGSIDNMGGRLSVQSGSYDGVISGAGGLSKRSDDTLSLYGAHLYEGSTLVEAGTLDLHGSLAGKRIEISAGALLENRNAGFVPDSSLLVDGGLRLHLDQTVSSLEGSGSVMLDSGRLTVGEGAFGGTLSGSSGLTKVSDGKLVLSGTNAYVGETRVEEGVLELSGSLASVSVVIGTDATLRSRSGGLDVGSALSNAGTLDLGSASDTVSSYRGGGTLVGSATLTAASYLLEDGASVLGNLGSGALTTVGEVTLSGTSDAETVAILPGSRLTLAQGNRLLDAAAVTVDGSLILGGGDETIRVLNGSGLVDVDVHQLTVTEGGNFSGTIQATSFVSTGGNFSLGNGSQTVTQSTSVSNGGRLGITDNSTFTTGNATVGSGSSLGIDGGSRLVGSNVVVGDQGSLDVGDSGSLASRRLTVGAGGTLNLSGGFAISYGTLTGGGTVQTNGGTFVNSSRSTVSGTLTFSGDFSNQGRLAPGNSPGVLTILGDYTEGGDFAAELGSIVPISGHDQIRVGGTVSLEPSSRLIVQTHGGSEPARGDVYQVISDLAGRPVSVEGRFGSVLFDLDGANRPGRAVSNAAVVFDVATGQVVATGLNAADSRYADLGTNRNQRAAARALFAAAQVAPKQIDTSDPYTGSFVRQMLDSSSNPAEDLARFSPDSYGALSDYLVSGSSGLGNLVRNRISPLAPRAEGGLFAGYLHHRFGTADDVDLSRNDVYVGADQWILPGLRIGALFSYNDGSLSHRRGGGSADGFGGMLYGDVRLSKKWSMFGNLGYSGADFNTRRLTQQGTVTALTSAESFSALAGVRFRAVQRGKFSLYPHLALSRDSASVDPFTETGAIDALRHGGYDADRLVAELGASAVWESSFDDRPLRFEVVAGVKQLVSESKDSMTATLVNDGRVAYPVGYVGGDSTMFNFAFNVSYQIFEHSSVYAGYEGLYGGNETVNSGQAGFLRRF